MIVEKIVEAPVHPERVVEPRVERVEVAAPPAQRVLTFLTQSFLIAFPPSDGFELFDATNCMRLEGASLGGSAIELLGGASV